MLLLLMVWRLLICIIICFVVFPEGQISELVEGSHRPSFTEVVGLNTGSLWWMILQLMLLATDSFLFVCCSGNVTVELDNVDVTKGLHMIRVSAELWMKRYKLEWRKRTFVFAVSSAGSAKHWVKCSVRRRKRILNLMHCGCVAVAHLHGYSQTTRIPHGATQVGV